MELVCSTATARLESVIRADLPVDQNRSGVRLLFLERELEMIPS